MELELSGWARRVCGCVCVTGYTVGYFGRIIQAKNLSKGGAFETNDEGFLRFKLGEGLVIPAFEEALYGMKVGGIRRFLVPPGPLSVRDLPTYRNPVGLLTGLMGVSTRPAEYHHKLSYSDESCESDD